MASDARVLVLPPGSGDVEAARRMVLRAMRIGLWVWPAFAVLDAWMCFVAYPGAPFLLFVAYRVVIEAIFFATYRASLDENTHIKGLFHRLNLSYGTAAIAISLMAVHLGGIESPYMHGISIVSLVRAALVPTHWRRAVRTYGRIGLAFPMVMSLGALASPAYRAQWFTADALIVFASNYVFVVASSFVGMVSGHVAWTAQEQLFRARRLGRYRLQALLGKGGMGEVWLAWDLSLHRNVALKILRTSGTPSPEVVKRFEREAQAAGQLRGPHVVQVFDYGASDDGLYYIAMEYLSGRDLANVVAEFGPLPAARAISIAMQACLALEEAHAAGIIHRDLKPHNLILTRVGDDPDFVKLLDFGIARLRGPVTDAERLTWTGVMVGTPSYLAPELFLGAEADERSDIYALGVTLHFLVSGSTPFDGRDRGGAPGVGAGDVQTMQALEAAGALGARLVPIVVRCLAREPGNRFQSARALHDTLLAVHDPGAWTREDAEAFWRAADRRRFG
jgi:serine/threonine-protein kinase